MNSKNLLILIITFFIISSSTYWIYAQAQDNTVLLPLIFTDPHVDHITNNSGESLFLYAVNDRFYAFNPKLQETTFLGYPAHFNPSHLGDVRPRIIEATELKSWPIIEVTDGYTYLTGLHAPVTDEIIYVEGVCEQEHCDSHLTVWYIDEKLHKRSLVTSNENPDLLLTPIYWNEQKGVVLFEAFDLKSHRPFHSIWEYDLRNNAMKQVILPSAAISSHVWVSPDNQYLLTSISEKIDDLDTTKLIQIDSNDYSINYINTGETNQEISPYGWANPDMLEAQLQQNIQVSGLATVVEADSGFQRPMTNYHYGYHWLNWTGSLFHPGDDYNGAGSGNADCGTDIFAVANGVVRHLNLGGWGTLVVEHNWQGTTVYSQYGHLESIRVSVEQPVSKGQHIADMGRQGADSCHLHWEIRKANHPHPTNSGYYDSSTLSNLSLVQANYENPEEWVDNHGPYGAPCPSPTLISPGDGHTLSNRTVTFSWQAISGCGNGYTFRIKDTGNMESGGTTLVDTGEGGTARTVTIPAQYENRDLYWGVKAANATNANWAVRRFRIQTSSGSTPTATPTAVPATPVPSGQVKLYSLANYGSSVLWNGNSGFSNEPNANSYALQIPSGWSAKTWRGDNRSGDDRTWCSSVANLQDHGWHLAIQSIEVYNFPCSSSGGSSTTLCTDDNATQGCTNYDPGLYQLGGTALNDQYRSVKSVASGKSIMLYRESGFRGVADCFNGSRIPLVDGSDPNWDLRGQVTDFQVFTSANCPTSELKSLMIYRDSNAGGPMAGVGVSAGVYNLGNIGGPVNRNDWLSSIRVPVGKSVYVYQHDNRGGERSGCLTGTANLFGALDRQASSVWLFDNPSCTPSVPDTPGNFQVTGSTQNSITLAWSNVVDESGYRIEQWNGSSWLAAATVGTDVTTWTPTGLSCGMSYSFRLSAYNGTGSSVAVQSSGSTQSCPPPTPTATFTPLPTLTPTPLPTLTPTFTSTPLYPSRPAIPTVLAPAHESVVAVGAAVTFRWQPLSYPVNYLIYIDRNGQRIADSGGVSGSSWQYTFTEAGAYSWTISALCGGCAEYFSGYSQLYTLYVGGAPTATYTPTTAPTITPSHTPTPLPPTATPTATATPNPVCSVSIGNGRLYTNQREITIYAHAPGAAEVQLSNDGGFGGAIWQPYAPTLAWTLSDPPQKVATLLIFARFRDQQANLLCSSGALIDDIIYDAQPPVVHNIYFTLDEQSAERAAETTIRGKLTIAATDQAGGSGVPEMRFGVQPDLADATWQPFTVEAIAITLQDGQTLYAQVRDGAGNPSATMSRQVSSHIKLFLPLVER